MKKLQKFRTLPLGYIILAVMRKVFRLSQNLAFFCRDRILGTDLSDHAFTQALGTRYSKFDSFLLHIATRKTPHFFLDPEKIESLKSSIKAIDPNTTQIICLKADEACEHTFDLLGSGPTFLGDEVDWHQDFKTRHHWKQTYYAFIRPAPFPGSYDIKVPWELSRCQHFIWLGQAFLFTQDRKYAEAFQNQIMHWIEQNPLKFGVNWACTMDVAIRVVNWIWGFFLFKGTDVLPGIFHQAFFKSLLAHGRFIFENLEVYRSHEGRFTNNHYLANLIGLIYLGLLFPEFEEAHLWKEFGLDELEREMFHQVYEDGFSFESSTSYHRLTLEMISSAVILARHNHIVFSRSFMQRLEKMFEVVLHITKPDGTIPLIGDQDNSRLHRLKVWPEPQQEWVDFRYLLAIGAVLFQRQDFAWAAGDQWQEAFWLLGDEAIHFRQELSSSTMPSPRFHATRFQDAGIHVMRGEDFYLIIDAGGNGQHGLGGHAHNDHLSFELFSKGHTWIIDPGTYVYTSDYNERRLFRSTAFHNTIRIDAEEINRFDHQEAFHFQDDAPIHINHWITDEDLIIFDAEHHGYHRLSSPVNHRRQIICDTRLNRVLLRDKILGHGRHQIESFIHINCADEQLHIFDKTSIQIWNPNGVMLNIIPLEPNDLELTIHAGWISRSYGHRKPAPIIIHRKMAGIPTDLTTYFSIWEPPQPEDRQQWIEYMMEKLFALD